MDRFTASDIAYLKTVLTTAEEKFFDWLAQLDCRDVKISAIKDGSVVFPREPLIRVEGPIGICQLLETTLLNLVNFPSLIATNAARMKLAAGKGKKLIEFGLRRAQGPDGGVSASKYAFVGGFEGTSNVLAGKLFGITVSGTHAHSFVMSYSRLSELEDSPFKRQVLECRQRLGHENTNEGELAAFVAYATSFPDAFIALVDTYDMLASGVKNFLAVAWALYLTGHQPRGVRLDSGDLAYFSKQIREEFRRADAIAGQKLFEGLSIVASNDINEDVLLSLNREGHEIDVFGIGTHLVTCQKQPALGCVYKLVEVNGSPRIKVSQEAEKMVIPGRKEIFRLYGAEGHPLVDLMVRADEPAPQEGSPILVRHPFVENKRANIRPTKVVRLLSEVFSGTPLEAVSLPQRLEAARLRCQQQMAELRSDHSREVNPAPYKVSVSASLYDYLKKVWSDEMPISELK